MRTTRSAPGLRFAPAVIWVGWVLLMPDIAHGQGFGAPVDVNLGIGQAPRRITGVSAGDFDGDGNGDLVGTENASSGRIGYSLGIGGGAYGAAAVVTVFGSGPLHHPTLGDFDRDGLLDVAVAGTIVTTGELAIYVAQGKTGVSGFYFDDPLFAYALGSGSSVTDLAVTDFDRDGFLDVLATFTGPVDDRLGVLYGQAPPSPSVWVAFAPVTTTSVGVGAEAIDVCVDFNKDGRKDLVIAGSSASGGAVTILPGNAGPIPGPPIVIPLGANVLPRDVHWIDCNQDGFYDIAVASGGAQPQVQIARNIGAPTYFGVSTLLPPFALSAPALSLLRFEADFDGSEDLSLFLVQSGGTIAMSRYQTLRVVDCQLTSAGPSSPIGNYDGAAVPPAVADLHAVADLDFDGKEDLIIVSHGSPASSARVFRNLGLTDFTISPTRPLLGQTTPFTFNAEVPPAFAGHKYAILFSFAGTLPGLMLGSGLALPLNPPPFPLLVLGTVPTSGPIQWVTAPISMPAVPTAFSAHLSAAVIVEGSTPGVIGWISHPAVITLP